MYESLIKNQNITSRDIFHILEESSELTQLPLFTSSLNLHQQIFNISPSSSLIAVLFNVIMRMTRGLMVWFPLMGFLLSTVNPVETIRRTIQSKVRPLFTLVELYIAPCGMIYARHQKVNISDLSIWYMHNIKMSICIILSILFTVPPRPVRSETKVVLNTHLSRCSA